jgi:tetratricopeptide (TPR) repeat protein
MSSTNRIQAQKILDLALELDAQGNSDDAINAYLKAAEIDPTWSNPLFNVGLIYKHRLDWKNSLLYNMKSHQLDKSDQPSLWNMGIAATALKDWNRARYAWETFGIPLPKVPDAATEIRINIGMTPIRLAANREVVWTDRIDPARGIIKNIPTQESNRRYLDIVLHDGAPNGFRQYGQRQVPVFDELELFEASPYGTYLLKVHVANEKKIDILEKALEDKKYALENWTNSIRYVCKKCSEGIPHEHHDKELENKAPKTAFNLALAATSESTLKQIIDQWLSKSGAEVIDFQRIM